MSRSGLNGIGHIPFAPDTPYHREVCKYLGYRVPTKVEFWRQWGYRPLSHIIEMHKSRATHRILAGGNRGGKTYGAAYEVAPYLFWYDTTGWIVSRTYDVADQLRQEIQGILTDKAGLIKGTRATHLSQGEFHWSAKSHLLTMWTGSTLALKSAESPDSMHAVPVDYHIIDEAALFPFLYYDTRLVPRLVDSGGWILGVGTFEFLQGEWFEEYFDIGQGPNDLDIVSFMLPTPDNFHVYYSRGGETPEQVAQMYHTNWRNLVKTNPGVDWPLVSGVQVIIYNIDLAWLEKERKRIDPRTYKARYLAQSVGSQFQVFSAYKVSKFVNAKMAEFDPDLPVYLAIDPGSTYAVGVIQLKSAEVTGVPIRNNLCKYHVCLIDEIYVQQTITTEEIYNKAKEREWFKKLYRHEWEDSMVGAIDVMAPEIARTWQLKARTDGFESFRLRKKKVNIVPGNMTLQHYLDTETLWIHPRCRWFSTEMKRYHYRNLSPAQMEASDPRAKDKPVDEWNHLIKALIYFLVIKFGYYGRSAAPAAVSKADIQKAITRREREAAYARRY